MSDKAKLIYGDKEIELPVFEGTEDELAIDISKLRAQTGLITLDVGYKNTGSTPSEITYIHGEKGILRFRGYSIEELAEKKSFIEVAYLLVFGELPTQTELKEFSDTIKKYNTIDEDIKKILGGFPKTAHPMGVISSLSSALNAFENSDIDVNNEEEVYHAVAKIIAQFTVIAAWTFNKLEGKAYNYADDSLDYTSNILKMFFADPTEEYKVDEVVSKGLDKLLILHADHEQNCSTSTVRIVGSSHASLYSSISAGVSALWGPLHGGANQAVVEMLEEITTNGGDVEKYISKAKDKSDDFRLMGFGHRLYKNFDPRAKIIKGHAENMLNALGVDDPMLDVAKRLEKAALEDEYFAKRKLYPNVDFYSGIIYKAMGIPVEMFTVLFAIGRLPGWVSQWLEMRKAGQPIGRPRQLYMGKAERNI